MRFAVTRTSVSDEDVQPCKEAVRGEIRNIDRRTFKSAEEHDKRLSRNGQDTWLSRGTNHRKDGSGIARDLDPVSAWYVEIDSLEALIKFYGKYGDLVLRPAWQDNETPTIEIYDGYRE